MKNNIKNILLLSAITLIMSMAEAKAACYNKTCAEMGYVKALNQCDPEQGILKCPFDLNLYYCFDKPCKPGYIYYSDKTCSPDIISGKTPIGVVGYLNNALGTGLVVALDEANKSWSDEFYDLPCIKNADITANKTDEALASFGGKENTSCIMQTKNSRGVKYPAGEYCDAYSTAGSNDWFLPSSGEAYQALYSQKDKVNATLKKLGKTVINDSSSNSAWYQTSTEAVYFGTSDNTSVQLHPYDGNIYYVNNKRINYPTRCVLAF